MKRLVKFHKRHKFLWKIVFLCQPNEYILQSHTLTMLYTRACCWQIVRSYGNCIRATFIGVVTSHRSHTFTIHTRSLYYMFITIQSRCWLLLCLLKANYYNGNVGCHWQSQPIFPILTNRWIFPFFKKKF